ncbi:hypothetical protein F638_1019 [Pseudomonas sp. LAIL14HWK12:I2]|jgi:hypothetical protein|uniref:hypothetical protein n=1 Tax=Pseudomonas sp. LAIL14HWK12:I2 TaxID=1265482 RepID=UPI001067C4ED|nr:hypothetical protein [Pseudomonas sp. LAIL14HWK12:I2]TFA86104.1 hypothetical protein F638_1019 [Pseudomonas sp. LAIL14HWK12:I2]
MQEQQTNNTAPYLITANGLAMRLAIIARQHGNDVPLKATITGCNIALTVDTFHVSQDGTLVIQLPPSPYRVKHYHVHIFGQRLNVVAATDFDNLRRLLSSAEERISQLEKIKNDYRPDPRVYV